MADNKIEKITKLTFDINDATKSLDEVNKKLSEIAKTSEQYAIKIGKNINQSLNIKIDNKSLQKSLNENVQFTQKQQAQIQKKAIMTQQEITKTVEKENAKQKTSMIKKNNAVELEAQKHANKMIEINEKQAKSIESLGNKISKYAKTFLIYQGFNMLKRGIQDTIKEMVNVQYQMVQIDRVLNDSTLNIDNYRDRLIQLAYNYGNSFQNVADITLRLAQAGFNADESIALTEKTLLALNTAELDSKQATSDMIAVMAQWGLTTGDATQEAKDYGDIIDKINKVADNFPTTSKDILDALKKTSSAFNLAGASIDETIATIVAAEKASQRGGKVIGTALNSIIQQLKTTGRLTKAEELGLDFYKDVDKKEFKSIIDIFQEMSEKMEQLKKAGKEDSVEMQNLLEIFTVLRRNIGASLLGEMSGGEESTYAQVLKTSLDSVGYSLEENAKHMETAKAAQAQFNATLLELKTAVWDNGVENVFRSMLLLGKDVTKTFTFLIKTFGAFPTAIGTAVAVFSTFNKNMKISQVNTEKMKLEYAGLTRKIKDVKIEIDNYNKGLLASSEINEKIGKGSLKEYIIGLEGAKASAKTYGSQLAWTTLKTIGLKAATIALNAALTLGLSAGITLILTGLDNLIHAEEKHKEKIQDTIDKNKEEISTLESKRKNLESMFEEYNKLSSKPNKTKEDDESIKRLQLEINAALKDRNKYITFATTSEEEFLQMQKEITKEMQEQALLKKEEIVKNVTEKKQNTKLKFPLNMGREWSKEAETLGYTDTSAMVGGYKQDPLQLLQNDIMSLNVDEQIAKLTEWKQHLEEIGHTGTEMYDWITNSLNELNKAQNEVNKAEMEYYDLFTDIEGKKIFEETFPEGSVTNIEEYNEGLQRLNNLEVDGSIVSEMLKDKLIDLYEQHFPEFANKNKLLAGDTSVLKEVLLDNIDALQKYAEQYSLLENAQYEYNTTGEMTIQTLQGLINNDLLGYLSLQNGKLQLNTQSMLNLAEAAKVDTIETLQSAAAKDIQKAAIGDVNNMSIVAKNAISQFGNNTATAGGKAKTAAGQIAILATSMQDAYNAAKGKLAEGVDVNTFNRQANAIMSAYRGIANTISNINIKAAAYSPHKTGGRGSGRGSSFDRAKRDAEQAARDAERQAREAERKAEQERKEAERRAKEEYDAKLKMFKEFVKERERLEDRWVDKQKDLGLLSTKDFLYITEQRINRYNKYLEEVKKATWLNAEDRAKIEKEYSETIEDLQVDYLEYLKDQLDDQIKELEEANKKKIDLINEEADKRINALKKVEDETDRIRRKEEYQKKREEHLTDIHYWEQRTGREAQEALQEAKKDLKELDDDWKEQLEDWSIEDQIKAIEEERDAQINAIEETQKKQIEAWEAAYQERVTLFGETGKIIYDNTVIQSQNLYKVYRENFVDPLENDLKKLNKDLAPKPTPPPPPPPAPKPAPTPQKQYETYLIKYGDTLSGIAKKFGTTIDKIMKANPYIKNKNRIYAGRSLQIPKFHNGGIVGGHQEAFALLKPNEVILKTEWAEGINKLVKMAKNSKGDSLNQSTIVQVKGNLINVEADIKNKSDVDFLERKLERMLNNKFNIKK